MMNSCAPSKITATSRHRRKLRPALFAKFTEITDPTSIKGSPVVAYHRMLFSLQNLHLQWLCLLTNECRMISQHLRTWHQGYY